MISPVRRVVGIVLALGALTACGAGEGDRSAVTTTGAPGTPPPPTSPASTAMPTPTTAPSGTLPAGEPEAVVEVRYRVERRTGDEATATFAAVVDETLQDPRGWERARFRLVRDDHAEYAIVIAEGAEVDALCHPYETWSTYSCQNGPIVAINADRWRRATPKWTGDPATYRQMLVNHEVGHLLGQHHPEVQCPERGQPAAVMAQQSTELDGCLPNAWPLPWEIELAARHEEPLAPPY